MNEKPVQGSDAQAQPASAAMQSPEALATITSGARRVREALSRVIVGQNQSHRSRSGDAACWRTRAH